MKRLVQALASIHEDGIDVSRRINLRRTGGPLYPEQVPTWEVNWSAIGQRPAEDAAAFARDLAFAADLAERLTAAEAAVWAEGRK